MFTRFIVGIPSQELPLEAVAPEIVLRQIVRTTGAAASFCRSLIADGSVSVARETFGRKSDLGHDSVARCLFPLEVSEMATESDLEHWLAQRQKIAEQLKSFVVDGRHTSCNGVDTTDSEIERLRVRLAEHQAIIADLRARRF